MEFLRSFLRGHFAGKPVLASCNVGCFLRLVFDTLQGNIKTTNRLSGLSLSLSVCSCLRADVSYFFRVQQRKWETSARRQRLLWPGRLIRLNVNVSALASLIDSRRLKRVKRLYGHCLLLYSRNSIHEREKPWYKQNRGQWSIWSVYNSFELNALAKNNSYKRLLGNLIINWVIG